MQQPTLQLNLWAILLVKNNRIFYLLRTNVFGNSTFYYHIYVIRQILFRILTKTILVTAFAEQSNRALAVKIMTHDDVLFVL